METNASPARRTLGATTLIALAAALNTALYHVPLYSFAASDLDLRTGGGILTLATLPIVVFLETALILTLLALISHRILKPVCMLMAIGNAVALYFLVTYRVILDVTMMGNVLGTRFGEASEFLNPTLVVYALCLGAVPAWLLARVRVERSPRSRLVVMGIAAFLSTVAWAYVCAGSWLWIDKNSKRLGGTVLPWSYVINAARYEAPRILGTSDAALLPVATFASDEKTVVILVIGEAARAQNFSMYGYARATNPSLSTTGAVALANTTACATYTTAAVRCILSNVDAEATFATRYEPLTSYLQRSGVEVIWRTRNFGEPPMHVRSYQKAADLAATCTGTGCQYDDVLLSGLEQRIRAASSRRVLVVLHQMGSHGPAYFTRYPPEFERFVPVCKSVEIGRCSTEALVNAYDNTILFEDHFLSQAIGVLGRLEHTSAALIYISDHGESLGEHGLYLHGMPFAIAPDVQKSVPFIVWMSDEFQRRHGVPPQRLASQAAHSQRDVFHSVMGAFAMRSDAYVPGYDVFSEQFGGR